MASCLKTYDGTEIFEHDLNPNKKAYVTGTPIDTDGHLSPQIFDNAVYLGENAGELVATTFKGALTGNATSATKATKDSAGQQINTTYIKGLSVSGKTITYTRGDNTTGTITTQDTNITYSNMTGATSSAAGKAGLVPAPAAGKQSSFLKGDGTWAVPTDTKYTHPTSSGNKHIPAGGSSGQILRWSSDGTAVWGADNNTTYSQATSSALGLVKIGFPESGKNYPVELNTDGQMYVNVPWTDNDTTYTSLKNPNTLTVKGNGTTSFTYDGSSAKTLNIKAGSNVSVSSDTSGNITISSTDTNTTYTSLKNPYSLTIQGNGTTLTNGTYDGSAAKTVNITPSSIGAAASGHNHAASNITSGILPVTRGGTGNDISDYPDGCFLVKYSDSNNKAFIDYRSSPLSITLGGTGITSNPSMLTNLGSTTAGSVFASAPRPGVTGTLGLSNGGTGISTLADAPNNAIIRKGADVNYLYYTATKKGAFYANSENGTPTFGVLPATIGGTGNDISDYPDGCFLVKQTASDGSSFIDYYSNPLGISVGGTGASTASRARTNLGLSYATSAPTSAPSTGAGAVCFVVDNGDPLPVSEGGTGASTKVNAIKNLGMYPVGSVYVSSTNSNPSSYLGGTWECFDKELKGKLWDSTSTSGFWTYNSTNTESDSQVYAYVEGHKIHIRFDIHTKVEMGESSYNLGTLDYETMGFDSFPYSAIYAAAVSDGGNAVGYCRLDYASGVLQIVDINPKADGGLLGAGAWLYLILEMPITTAAMYDKAVDRFHWKRTA